MTGTGSAPASSGLPKREAGRRAWAAQTGGDGLALLAVARADDAPRTVREQPALEILRQVWVQNFLGEYGPEGPRVGSRANGRTPPSGRYIGSPYDAAAHYPTKRATVWRGDKVYPTGHPSRRRATTARRT